VNSSRVMTSSLTPPKSIFTIFMLPQPLNLSDGIIKNYVGKWSDNYVENIKA
jgi:hypothetical protein